jgi:hypothetical protein
MSDTVAVALITGGLAGAAGLASGILAYRSAKSQGETNLAIAGRGADVELQKITAENERLREQRREDERQQRLGSYHQLVNISTKLYRAFGDAVEKSETEKLIEEYNWLLAGLLLYAPESVQDRAYELNDIVRDTGEALEEQDSSLSEAERWREASAPYEDMLGNAVNQLAAAMRADIQRSGVNS